MLVPVEEQEYFALLTDNGNVFLLAGRGLVVGSDDDGNTVAPHATIAEMFGRVSWPNRLAAEKYAAQFV